MTASSDEYGDRRTACSILHERLTGARGQNGDTAIRRVWAMALGIRENDLVAVIRGIADTAGLADAARTEVELYLDPMLARETVQVWQKLDQLFAFDNLGAPWRNVSGLLEPPTLDLLKVAHLSIRDNGARQLPRKELAEFKERFYALLNTVQTTRGSMRR